MDTPTPPEWVVGPLLEEWELGKRQVERERMFGGSMDMPWSSSVSNRARIEGIRAWTLYYREMDNAKNEEG